jgi:hypothetical protein
MGELWSILHLFVSGLAALNQGVAFAAALVCAAIGLALLRNAVYSRVHAIRV